tara:strand:+ start:222 stop:353 length:132 start_codon:yes stop_codon:yes gene_type:complete
MAEKDYTEGSKKWPKTPGKDWQLTKKNKKNKDVESSFHKGYHG